MENLNDGLCGYHNDRYELINDLNGEIIRESNSVHFLLQYAKENRIVGCIMDHMKFGEIVENFDFRTKK